MELPITHTLTTHTAEELVYYTFPALEQLPFIRHGFSTRLGGVSQGIYASMNLGFSRGDDPACVQENYLRITRAIGVDWRRLVMSAQTHTTNVVEVTAEDCGRGILRERGYIDVDGLITDQPQVVLCTHYADCVPLFFVDPVRRVIGLSHSGWKGTAGRMGAVTVRRMQERYGCRPADILAGIGPSIGPCCFEVDEPVYRVFAAMEEFTPCCATEDGGGKYHVDLWEINRRILLAAGLEPDHITVTDLCTMSQPDVFWSHRATQGQRGSAAAFLSMDFA